MHSIILATLGFLASTALTTADLPVHDALRALPRHPDGFIHIADDGVARSYDDKRQVIAHVGLSNSQLMDYIKALPSSQHDHAHLYNVYNNVNGLEVTDNNQLNYPPSSLAPPPGAGTKTTTSDPSKILGARKAQASVCEDDTCMSSKACQAVDDLDCSGCNFIDAEVTGKCQTA